MPQILGGGSATGQVDAIEHAELLQPGQGAALRSRERRDLEPPRQDETCIPLRIEVTETVLRE